MITHKIRVRNLHYINSVPSSSTTEDKLVNNNNFTKHNQLRLLFDRECPACDFIPDSSLLLHHHSLFMKFVQLTINGAELGTEVPVWY